MIWRVQSADVQQFRRDLWKDERSFKRPEGLRNDEFPKDCFDAVHAELELVAIGMLMASPGEQICPEARPLRGSLIALKRIDGIRMFDLVRLLRQVEQNWRDGKAARAEHILMARQRDRLTRIQRVLFENKAIATSAYPMDNKLSDLLALLARVFGSEERFDEAREDLRQFGCYWQEHCCLIPFRDATAKNTLVGEPMLLHRLYDDDADRLAVLEKLIAGSPRSYWEDVALWDIDFSSVEHLTTPEDDPISLHCHEWTDGSCPVDSRAFTLLPDVFEADPFRTAATLVVRYLRFGGRKLAYKVINAQGFEVRFRYDNPLFYFQTLRTKCATLSPDFVQQYSKLFDVIEDIGYRASNPSPADEALLRVDHFRKQFQHNRYWQESPNERGDDADDCVELSS
jgi:hypothetical protein